MFFRVRPRLGSRFYAEELERKKKNEKNQRCQSLRKFSVSWRSAKPNRTPAVILSVGIRPIGEIQCYQPSRFPPGDCYLQRNQFKSIRPRAKKENNNGSCINSFYSGSGRWNFNGYPWFMLTRQGKGWGWKEIRVRSSRMRVAKSFFYPTLVQGAYEEIVRQLVIESEQKGYKKNNPGLDTDWSNRIY